MPLTFADLLSPPSLTAVRESFLTNLAALGYVSSWAAAGAGRALAEIAARGLGDLNDTASLVAQAGLLDFAAQLEDPAWLDALAWGFFDEVRQPASLATIRVRLTNAPSGSTQNIDQGQLLLSRSDNAVTYRNTGGTTLAANSHVDLEFTATTTGTEGNFENLVPSVQLVTAIAGVTAALHDEGSGDPMVSLAEDTETNPSLAARCRLKWATLAYSDPSDKLVRWALDVQGITKALVDDDNPRGPYTVDVYLANDTGAAETGDRDDAQDIFDARCLLPSNVLAIAATEDATTLTATVYARGREQSAVEDDVKAAVVARQAAMEIGDGASVRLYRAQLVEDLMRIEGVYNVTVSAPASDLTPALGHLIVLDPDAPGVTVTIAS